MVDELGALVIAFLAFVRPELGKLWNKWFKPPIVDIFESGQIEIGFNQFGPIVNLFGTWRAVHADAFIAG